MARTPTFPVNVSDMPYEDLVGWSVIAVSLITRDPADEGSRQAILRELRRRLVEKYGLNGASDDAQS